MDNKTYPSYICISRMDRVKYAWCTNCLNKADSKPMNVNFKIKSFTFLVNDRDGKKSC